MNEVLKLTDVVKRYNTGYDSEHTVLNHANLTVQKGEVIGLMAPSGVGKSTLLHIAGLLDTPTSGMVEINQQNMADANDGKRTLARQKDVGFIYQFHHLLPELSALENVMLPQLIAGVDVKQARKHAQSLLSSVHLQHRVSYVPQKMSGGEQQRVAFCRALANGPSLLLADEPTGNLDAKTSDVVFDTLLSVVKQNNLTALIATHNIELVQKMDRVVTLQSGQIVEI